MAKVKLTTLLKRNWRNIKDWYFSSRLSEHQRLLNKLSRTNAAEKRPKSAKELTQAEWAIIDEAHTLGYIADVHLTGLSPQQMYDVALSQIKKNKKKKK